MLESEVQEEEQEESESDLGEVNVFSGSVPLLEPVPKLKSPQRSCRTA